jgi:hypothetical protein
VTKQREREREKEHLVTRSKEHLVARNREWWRHLVRDGASEKKRGGKKLRESLEKEREGGR